MTDHDIAALRTHFARVDEARKAQLYLTAPELVVFEYRDGIWQDDKQRVLHLEPVIAARCTLSPPIKDRR
ncbi:MAG TPA: hypothetical protein VJ783_16545 [Pirellulales bacterium]|nr:hypothetical protein [Pirellulales bacterium]